MTNCNHIAGEGNACCTIFREYDLINYGDNEDIESQNNLKLSSFIGI